MAKKLKKPLPPWLHPLHPLLVEGNRLALGAAAHLTPPPRPPESLASVRKATAIHVLRISAPSSQTFEAHTHHHERVQIARLSFSPAHSPPEEGRRTNTTLRTGVAKTRGKLRKTQHTCIACVSLGLRPLHWTSGLECHSCSNEAITNVPMEPCDQSHVEDAHNGTPAHSMSHGFVCPVHTVPLHPLRPAVHWPPTSPGVCVGGGGL